MYDSRVLKFVVDRSKLKCFVLHVAIVARYFGSGSYSPKVGTTDACGSSDAFLSMVCDQLTTLTRNAASWASNTDIGANVSNNAGNFTALCGL